MSWICGRPVLHAALVTALAVAAAACTSSEETEQPDWREHVIYARVGNVVYELAPANKIYSLAGLSDEEIAAAIAAEKGTRGSPLQLRDIRVGVFGVERNDLRYDVTIVRPEFKGTIADAVPLDRRPGDVMSVAFEPDVGNQTGTLLPGSASLRFSDGKTVELPVECAARPGGGEAGIIFCSTGHFVHRGNLMALRSRGRGASGVAQDFQGWPRTDFRA